MRNHGAIEVVWPNFQWGVILGEGTRTESCVEIMLLEAIEAACGELSHRIAVSRVLYEAHAQAVAVQVV